MNYSTDGFKTEWMLGSGGDYDRWVRLETVGHLWRVYGVLTSRYLCLSSVMRWVPPRAAHHDALLLHTHPEAKMEILRQKTSFPLVCAITVVQVITHHAYFWVWGKISQVWANCFWCAYIAKASRLRLIFWSQMKSDRLTEDPSLPL